MEQILTSILFGILGGLIRALVGIAKYFEKNKKENKINTWYLGFSLFTSGLIGGVAGSMVEGSWKLSLIAGYAGTDFLESLYKIKKKQGFEI